MLAIRSVKLQLCTKFLNSALVYDIIHAITVTNISTNDITNGIANIFIFVVVVFVVVVVILVVVVSCQNDVMVYARVTS